MKKIGIIIVFVFINSLIRAQFLYSLGIAAGVSYGKETWTAEQYQTKEKYLLGPNGAVLAEFFRGTAFNWRAEIMYNGLGTKEAVSGENYTNTTNYISLNNYLKYTYEFVYFKVYGLVGPRVEYLLNRKAAVYPDVINGMSPLHLSAAGGVGFELYSYSHIKPFAEAFYNRDISPSFNGNFQGTTIVSQHDFEFRLGLKYVFNEKNKCPKVDNSAGQPPGGF